jgi:hypothetical protein
MDTCGNARRIAVLRGDCGHFSNCGVDMTTFCHECGRYQGHEKTCSQSEQVTIDDLSHENSLIRARNDRLEADRLYLINALTDALNTLRLGTQLDISLVKFGLAVVISKLTGSAT